MPALRLPIREYPDVSSPIVNISVSYRGANSAVVETRIQEYHGERRGDLIYTKPMLLAIGDMYEQDIARDRQSLVAAKGMLQGAGKDGSALDPLIEERAKALDPYAKELLERWRSDVQVLW